MKSFKESVIDNESQMPINKYPNLKRFLLAKMEWNANNWGSIKQIDVDPNVQLACNSFD